MIKLMDLIGLAGVKLGKFKIHCATGDNPTPLEAFCLNKIQTLLCVSPTVHTFWKRGISSGREKLQN
jgi:hypothetical protein